MLDPFAARTLAAFATLTVCAMSARAEPSATELAKQLSNPVAALISVPFQYSYDTGFGTSGSGDRSLLNIQPVVPISLNDDWNVISRTILPIISQHNVTGPAANESGLGDVVQSVFFSPKKPTASGWIWGAGPVLLAPTGRDGFTANQWALGPTAVVLKQDGPYTYGALWNHLWGVAGSARAESLGLPEVNATFIQPFFSRAVGKGATIGLNTESSYDWTRGQWTVPVNLTYGQVLPVRHQLVSVGAGVRAYAVSPHYGPDWGLRVTVTLLFPR